jgi:hypothetical protein
MSWPGFTEIPLDVRWLGNEVDLGRRDDAGHAYVASEDVLPRLEARRLQQTGGSRGGPDKACCANHLLS